MPPIDDYPSIEAFVDDNREMLERVLRHSSNPYARACAWALIDAGSAAPDITELEQELSALQETV